MSTKRLFAGLLALLLCLAFVSCNTTPPEPTDNTSDSKTSSTETSSSGSTSTSESTSSSASQTTYPTLPTERPMPTYPELPASSDDLESVSVGNHVTLRYNANAVDVTCEAKKGLGSKESVSIKVTPKNGFTFDGFSEGNAIVNGKAPVTTETTYEFTASEAVTVFANSSHTLTYHANGGEFKNGFDGTQKASAVFYLNPATLHENGSFAREGYTLVGYNTKEDGTGEYVSLGARVTANGKGAIDLFCVWEENTPADQFTYAEQNGGIVINKYNGTAETVTIPESIGGKTVVGIASDAFLDNATVKKIVIAKTVKTVAANAFNNCSALEALVFFDAAMTSMSDDCLSNCSAALYINTVYTLPSDWYACGSAKFDRLLWAKDKKKIIIVGGSGSLFGFDGAILDAALGGEYEIINLGENAQVTALMYFDVIEEFITEGDIVLWCPEPGSWTLGSSNCHSRFWDFRKADYGFMQYIDLDYYDNFFSSFSANCKKLTTGKFKPFDSLSASMSKYGDDRSPRKSKGEYYDYNFKGMALSEKDALTALFNNISAKGGKIFFSFAAMQDTGTWYINKADIDAYENMITALPGVTSISEYEGCIYIDKYFYDSPWHLTDEGASARAAFVAHDILRALGKIE